jgi:hypothetical protein
MAARPGGYASRAEQARRLEILRELWPTDRTLDQLGERLGLAATSVSHLARDAGLPPRHVREKKSLISSNRSP